MLSGFCRDSLVSVLYVPFLKKLFEHCSKKIDFKVDGNIIFMIFDSKNQEISIESEDHPLYLAYNSQQIGQNNSCKNCSSFQETNVNTSVYLALACKRFMNSQITLNRYPSSIEKSYKDDILR